MGRHRKIDTVDSSKYVINTMISSGQLQIVWSLLYVCRDPNRANHHRVWACIKNLSRIV